MKASLAVLFGYREEASLVTAGMMRSDPWRFDGMTLTRFVVELPVVRCVTCSLSRSLGIPFPGDQLEIELFTAIPSGAAVTNLKAQGDEEFVRLFLFFGPSFEGQGWVSCLGRRQFVGQGAVLSKGISGQPASMRRLK